MDGGGLGAVSVGDSGVVALASDSARHAYCLAVGVWKMVQVVLGARRMTAERRGLTARSASAAAFDGRCGLRAGGVAPPSNTFSILGSAPGHRGA